MRNTEVQRMSKAVVGCGESRSRTVWMSASPGPRPLCRPWVMPSEAAGSCRAVESSGGTIIDIRYRPRPGSGMQTSTSSTAPASFRCMARRLYPGGRSQSTRTSASMYSSAKAPPAKVRPSPLRTMLCAPSQPTRYRVRSSSSAPDGVCSRQVTPSASWVNDTSSVSRSTVVPKRPRNSSRMRSVSYCGSAANP